MSFVSHADFGGEGLTLLQLIEQYIFQLAVTVGVIVFTGMVIAGAKRVFLKSCRGGAYYVELATGFLGTPIHELSHAVFCLLFGHRIKKICLWTAKPQNGNIGYVTHTYRKRNLWHQIGNFFIGIAPIIGGSAVLLILLRLLLPDTAASLFSFSHDLPHEKLKMMEALLGQVFLTLRTLFDPSNFLRFHFYLYLFLAVLIVLHMEISGSDIRSGLWGFLFLSSIWLLLDLLLFFFYSEGLKTVTEICVGVGAILSTFFCLSVILSVLLLFVSVVALIVRKR